MPNLKMPGRYKATVVETKIAHSTKGTPYAGLLLRTDEREMADAYLYLSEKAFERTVKTLVEVFGFDGDFDTLERQVVGQRCSITAEEEEDDRGEVRVRVKWINPEQAAPADQSFLAKLTQRARALGAGKAAPPRPAKPATATPSLAVADDDDIPF
jgi:hypothetical protein